MGQTNTWQIYMGPDFSISINTVTMVPAAATLGTGYTVSCKVTNNGGTIIKPKVQLEYWDNSQGSPAWTLVPGTEVCYATAIGQGATTSLMTLSPANGVKFVRNTPLPLNPGEIEANVLSTKWDYGTGAGFKLRIYAMAKISTDTNCVTATLAQAHYPDQNGLTITTLRGTIASISQTPAVPVYTPTCYIGSDCVICSLYAKNDGNQAGIIYWKIYDTTTAGACPTPGPVGPSNPLANGQTASVGIEGTSAIINMSATAGTLPTTIGNYCFGVKLWGAQEPEPMNYSLIIGDNLLPSIDNNLIIAGVAVVGIVSAGVLYLYFSKKTKRRG